MASPDPDVINADLLAFFKAEKAGEGRVKRGTGAREAAVIGGQNASPERNLWPSDPPSFP
jgi:hypothetical protein